MQMWASSLARWQRCELFRASAEGNKASHVAAEGDNSPLVVSPRARGSACAAGVPAQFIIHMFPLSANCDLWGRRKRPGRDVKSQVIAKEHKEPN